MRRVDNVCDPELGESSAVSPEQFKSPAEIPAGAEPSSALARFVPLVTWGLALLVLLCIPFKIMSSGFVPPGDARRHVAQVFSGKEYTQVVVMRPEYTVNHSPGWEWLLRQLHRATGAERDSLICFSVVSLFLVLLATPLLWLRRPEVWLLALLAELVMVPDMMPRFTQGRPYLLTEGILVTLLFAWSRHENAGPASAPPGEAPASKGVLLLTFLGIALSVWMHGAWYLWVLPAAAFFLARRWRAGALFTACWLAGTLVGGVLTGKPVEFLKQALLIAAVISREHAPQWMLVGEFRPFYGDFATCAVITLVVIGGVLQGRKPQAMLDQPVFWLIVLTWILGFHAARFWCDWGVPAVLVWLAWQFQHLEERFWQSTAPQRLMACGLVALPLFLHATNDLERRYSINTGEAPFDAQDPALKGWLPDSQGIFYSAEMAFFYDMYYAYPQADWRYMVGFEPALMREEDLKIFRYIQRNQLAVKAYEPWIERMRPADRLAIRSAVPPATGRLEWINAKGNLWLGRLPSRK